jgi:hypothetical protein
VQVGADPQEFAAVPGLTEGAVGGDVGFDLGDQGRLICR